jgi:hypothetical protein
VCIETSRPPEAAVRFEAKGALLYGVHVEIGNGSVRSTETIGALVALVIVARILGNRRSTWILVLLGLAVTLGYVLSGHNN